METAFYRLHGQGWHGKGKGEKKKKNEQMKDGDLSFSMRWSCAKAFHRSAFLHVRMNWVWPQPQTKGFTCVFKERGGALRLLGDRRMRRVGMSALHALRRWILNTPWHRHVCVCIYGVELLPFSHFALLLVSPLAVKHVQTLLSWSSTSSKRKIHRCKKLALNNLNLYRHSNFTVASHLLTYANFST